MGIGLTLRCCRAPIVLIAAMSVVWGCGQAPGANLPREGFVLLSPDEAWSAVQRRVPEAARYQLCPDNRHVCAVESAYLRERTDLYWFVLHDAVSLTCENPSRCEPDRYRYIEVAGYGTIRDLGAALVRIDPSGHLRLQSGSVRWGIPDLDRSAP